MSSEICKSYRAQRSFDRLHASDNESAAELFDWEQRENAVYVAGEPMSVGRSFNSGYIIDVAGHVQESVVEKASRKDMQLRREEQIERAARMLEIEQKLTPQWRSYILKNAPHLILNKLLQKSA